MTDMQLKAMLVDDEINILRNIRNVLPWEDMEIDVVALARNGAEALELAREHRPDLILTDIRMPVMDGIDFLRKVREFDQSCEIIMLTGYQDFEYTQAAIRHGVKDYVLKPIAYEELEATVHRLAGQIRTRKSELRKQEKRWERVVHLAYDKLLFDALMGYSSVVLNDVLPAGAPRLEQFRFIMMLVDIDEYPIHTLQWNEHDRRLWNFAVKNVLDEALQDRGLKYNVLQMREGEWCVLVQQPAYEAAANTGQTMTAEWAGVLQSTVQNNVKLAISVAYYAMRVPYSGLPEAYKNAQRFLLVHPRERQIVSISEETLQRQEKNKPLWDSLEEIVSGLKTSDRDKTAAALQALNNALLAISRESIVRVEQFLHFLVIHLLREMRGMDVLSSVEEEAVWSKLAHSGNAKELMAVIVQLTESSLETSLGKNTGAALMMAAEDYIHRNLSSDLGIDELSDYLGISSSYFRLLFKMHFGETFVEYLTRRRMELAKSMLLMSDKSIASIGKTVGYPERRYFTKVFQKVTGVSPSEFRENR